MTIFSIYKITNLITGAAYIGLTTKNIHDRWRNHRSIALCGGNTPLQRAIRKYGSENFDIQHIACAFSFNGLKAAEIELIAQERSHVRDGGYNVTKGGDGALGRIVSEKTRKIMREKTSAAMTPDRRNYLSQLAKEQWSAPEMRALLSATNKGRKHSEETRRKVSVAGKAHIRTAQHCANLANALRGKSRPIEVRQKISAAKIGRPMSEQAKRNMSLAAKGKPKSAAHRAAIAATIRKQREAEKKCGM